MPLYEVKSLKLKSIWFSIFDFSLSAKFQAGVQIQNANFVGADLYKTVVDLYYPDLKGELKHIGYLKETNNDNGMKSCRNEKYNVDERIQSAKQVEHGYEICLPDEDDHGDSSPFFTVYPRGISTSESDALSIFVENVSPSVALNLIKDAIKLRGSLDMFISGVAQVKTPLGIPLSLGLFCDNAINLLQMPLQIIGKTCIVRSISTGWSGLKEQSSEIREHALDMYEKYGSIMSKTRVNNGGGNGDSDDGNDEMANFFNASETIIEWHDF